MVGRYFPSKCIGIPIHTQSPVKDINMLLAKYASRDGIQLASCSAARCTRVGEGPGRLRVNLPRRVRIWRRDAASHVVHAG
jgi:hypothetical protein